MEEDGGRRVEGLLEHSTYFVLFLKKKRILCVHNCEQNEYCNTLLLGNGYLKKDILQRVTPIQNVTFHII